MISVSSVSMRFGSKILFEDVTTTFSTGRRYGLTGPNGAGKSTFMKLLTGESDPQRGTVVRPQKIGVLRQGLDSPDARHQRKMGELRGEQKMRVLLAQALFGHPEALLLDEPTNHLDLDSIHWVEEFLNRYDGTLFVISHDRHFLNRVCTHIADIDYQTIITYTGGYDDMVMAKTQIRSRIESENAQREKKIAQLHAFIARFGAGTRASQTTSRRQEVERLQTTELARSNIA